jgi:acyl-CoA synthetase (AMP-forming)/AMP-acid ligase II
MAGVPFTYAMLARIGFEALAPPTLNTLTQAGGRLNPGLTRQFHESMERRGGRFVVMYGQTEATARIAYVPPDRLREKIGSIGIAIPGGMLWVVRKAGEPVGVGEEGELEYAGPNVMLGYASERVDLAKGDELRGVLQTGDLGHVDADGFFFVTGRAKRISKIFGLRINLDEVEQLVGDIGTTAVVSDDEKLFIFHTASDNGQVGAMKSRVAQTFRLNMNALEFRCLDALPTTAAGKLDYAKLQELCRGA